MKTSRVSCVSSHHRFVVNLCFLANWWLICINSYLISIIRFHTICLNPADSYVQMTLFFFLSHVSSQITFSHELFWLVFLLFLQERQSIIKYWLDNLRAKHGEALHNIHFLEGQPISRYFNTSFLLKCLRIHVFSPNLIKMLCVLGSTRAYSQGCDSSNVSSS